MRTITQIELNEILRLHLEWLHCVPTGKRANMSDADMRGANMRGADMRGANMSGANMSDADMSGANMRCANMRCANMSGANMSDADMSDADMRGANMPKRFVSITQIGSRKGMTTYCVDDNFIWCGCWKGNLEDFEKRVNEAYKDNPQYLKEYTGAIAYFRTFITEKK